MFIGLQTNQKFDEIASKFKRADSKEEEKD